MASIKFTPSGTTAEAVKDTKILVSARKCRVAIRFGCAAARCGTCAVKVSDPKAFTPMQPQEEALLKRMNLSIGGYIRLACQAKLSGECDSEIDISFQDTYSPDDLDGDGSL
jgi:ferredoxin